MNSESRVVSYVFLGMILLITASPFAIGQTGAQAAPGVTAPKAPTVTTPTVASPQVSAPAAAPVATQVAAPAATPVPRALLPAAPLVATKFEDGAYKQQIDAGTTVLLLFSETGDPVWTKQAPTLQTILKEAEFGRIAVFQIDTGTSPTVADRFLVKTPGTLIILKGGVERLRSTRMTKPDVIRKMLRLHTAL
ncbi:MAG: thioredoxin family protein [Bdellovibrionales bacterium]|nr:thioredoxin family protein [Bdellovibrionales bacterium]